MEYSSNKWILLEFESIQARLYRRDNYSNLNDDGRLIVKCSNGLY